MTFFLLATLAVALLYFGLPYLAWAAPGSIAVFAIFYPEVPGPLEYLLIAPWVALVMVGGIRPLRRIVVTKKAMRMIAPIFPSMSDTERVALAAGTVWWDSDLFSGNPHWQKLIDFKGPGLSPREIAFLGDEVDEVCRLVDNELIDETGDLSPEAWSYLKDKGFMGIIIPQEYGGLGFSPEANSAIVTKVSSRSVTLAVTVMVPNSLGPAELLLHYGTDEQKNYYLPRLASGKEIPAFALTEPGAGSDAGSMTSDGVVCKGQWKGEEVTGIKLNWDKRYITLAPVASLLGLAIKLEDPDHMIGDKTSLGITCVLVSCDLPGVKTGERHDPLGIKFVNGPTTGQDVFVPLDAIIGGVPMAGHGWRMLMDCLSAGRSLSLPGLACGGAEVTTRALSAYAMLREQFNMPIGRFEGIEEPLGRIAGMTWLMNATRKLTAAAVASGEKPSVVSAIVKCYLTEAMRGVVNDGMDIQGGAAICRGPRNVMARLYQGVPIGITVEGANILTRTLIVFGQGALRCHPYAFQEMEAARENDLKTFDKAFWSHIGFAASTATRAIVRALSGGRLGVVPHGADTAKYFRQLARLSAGFALCAEAAMVTLGGSLKRKERLTGRLADALAWLYMASACLKRYHDDGKLETDQRFMKWSVRHCLWNVQEALIGLVDNLPNRLVGRTLRVVLFPFGRPHERPGDSLASSLARAVMDDDELRDRLTADIYHPEADEDGLGRLDYGRDQLRSVRDERKKLKDAVRARLLNRDRELHILQAAVEQGVLTDDESTRLEEALRTQQDLIQVDAFGPKDYQDRCGA
ncbi:MAG: acyl-CoA dehydrogenase [Planctomycetota bacterium]|jgi:acyl-CoA dehydrogenase